MSYEYDAPSPLALAVGLILVLLAFCAAGHLDYQDRTEGVGASMMPDPEWVAGEVG